MVIANDHYPSIGIVCLSVSGSVPRVAHKRSMSFNILKRSVVACGSIASRQAPTALKPSLEVAPTTFATATVTYILFPNSGLLSIDDVITSFFSMESVYK